jgi:peptide/nickel transport system permease protein
VQQQATLAPAPFEREQPTEKRSFYFDVLVRLITEKPLGLAGAILILVFVIAAVAAPLVAPYGPSELGAGERLQSPSLSHPMGTDNLGRDVFSRVVYGARVSMTIGLLAVLTSTVIALTLGVLSGYFGGLFDMLVQRLVDGFIAFPGLVFILAVTAIFTDAHAPGLPEAGLFSTRTVVLMITMGVLFGVGSSRVIRASALAVKGQSYIEASRATGAGHGRLILQHVLPNVMPTAITLATLGLGSAILFESALAFLGLGVSPDVVTWGGMLNREARGWMTKAPWIAIFPGLALSLAVFGFNMLGDALRDLLDPRLRGS